MMTSKQRLLAALRRQKPDRLPVTTHHVMPSFLKRRLNGISNDAFFDLFGLDPIRWVNAFMPDSAKDEFYDPLHAPDVLVPRRVISPSWRIVPEQIPDPQYSTVRYRFVTPHATLTMVLQSDEHTAWMAERLVKGKNDIDAIVRYAVSPLCDAAEVNRQAEAYGERGLIRGAIPGFEVYGQPGCWQDAAVLYGIENLIYAAADDPAWVHAFLRVLMERKLAYIQSMAGASFDLVESGGGDASSTVISPRIFDEFVAPYDGPLIARAHEMGQRIVYHTCGGMMPLLERIAAMNPDAMETFTPASMGGDTRLAEAKNRIGGRVCMIGGFDQFHFLKDCPAEDTRREVLRCFEEAGGEGGYILAPSDHFFDADQELLRAFADEARACVY
jgi:uroporphyrinogen decarboxylase